MTPLRTSARIKAAILAIARRQSGTLVLWAPLWLGLGIAGYFSLTREPSVVALFGLAALTVALVVWSWKAGETLRPPVLTLAVVLFGFLDAAFGAHMRAAPVLKGHYYGPVEGRIVAVDRSSRDLPRITLGSVVLQKRSPGRTPKFVRISLHYETQYFTLEPGRHVMLTASLSAPAGPVEPGGFDFRRYAWFRGLGAVGYSRTPVLEAGPVKANGLRMGLLGLRMTLALNIRQAIPGQTGAFAAAILTGDRSAISPAIQQDLRGANLSHLLAISGLHMGLLSGFVFAVFRFSLALVPYLALRLPVRKIAAGMAILAAGAYLLLSGANVATQRAFVMVVVMLLAVVLDRRALTLRAVAMAALIVLLIRPESLTSAGFQMSFAATTALVAVFGVVTQVALFSSRNGWGWKIATYLFALVLSSTIAGLATAPVSAFHFNRMAQYGLLANIAAVPAMASVIMPTAVLAVLASAVGLDAPFWWLMGQGIDWVLEVAKFVAALDGAVVPIVKPPAWVLSAMMLGPLFMVLFRGRLRLLGLVPLCVALIGWGQARRPDILIAANGRLVGVMVGKLRGLSKPRGNGFAAENWLENDGDIADQATAAQRLDTSGIPNPGIWRTSNGLRVFFDLRKGKEGAEVPFDCAAYDLLIAPRIAYENPDCPAVTAIDLAKMGAVSVTFRNGIPVFSGSEDVAGARLWTR